MRSTLSLPAGLAAIILLACNSGVDAHTWVEQLRLIASNGSFVGAPGYIRNFGGRPPGVSPDSLNLYLLPPNGRPEGNTILPTDLMCRPSQVKQQQAATFPALNAAPGDQIALRYLENGHVTKFVANLGKPAGRGTVFIYGTKESKETDTYLGIHRAWNTEGTGGDKRGKLIATRKYDDGRCSQVNEKEPLAVSRQKALGDPGEVFCQNDFKIPTDVGTSGSYTLYWVWEWPTLDAKGAIVTNESYTSCMDINLTSNPVAAAGSFAVQNAVGQAAMSVAVEDQLGDKQFIVDPTAPPSLTADNLPAGATGVPAGPAKGGADQAPKPVTTSQPAQQTSAPAQPTSAPAQGFKTVTVTEKQTEMVTVTMGQSPSASSTPPKSSPKTTAAPKSSSVAKDSPAAGRTSTVIVTVVAPAASSTPDSAPTPVDNTAFSTFSATPMSSVLASSIPTPVGFLDSNNNVKAPADAASSAPQYAISSASASASPSACTPEARRKRSRVQGRSAEN